MRISRSIIVAGSVVLAGMFIGFTNPKAVHAAVTAVLVQVTNTASNPVVSGEVTLSPAQIVELGCPAGLPCWQDGPGGEVASQDAYVVPPGKTLVITDIDIEQFSIIPGATYSEFTIPSAKPYGISHVYNVPNDLLTRHFGLGHGILWPSGQTINTTGTSGLVGIMHGYLMNS